MVSYPVQFISVSYAVYPKMQDWQTLKASSQ